MKKTLLALALVSLLLPAIASADDDCPDLSARLEIDSSLWGGVDVMRAGRDVGPGFLNLQLADAVRGSANAERHAANATAWEATSLGLVVTAIGLIVADALVFGSEHTNEGVWYPFGLGADRSSGSMALGVGTLVSVIGAAVTQQLSLGEVFAAVNAYNRDLIAGRLEVR